jgi:transcriptional regulator with XRE-family HTH domain
MRLNLAARARKLGISTSHLSRVLRGERSSPRIVLELTLSICGAKSPKKGKK